MKGPLCADGKEDACRKLVEYLYPVVIRIVLSRRGK
jgi:hypothetical protein